MKTSSWNASARFAGFICVPEWPVYGVKKGIAGRGKHGEERVKVGEKMKWEGS
jgi:hypothetical protein